MKKEFFEINKKYKAVKYNDWIVFKVVNHNAYKESHSPKHKLITVKIINGNEKYKNGHLCNYFIDWTEEVETVDCNYSEIKLVSI